MEEPARRWADWLEAANYAFKSGAFTEAAELYSGALGDASSTSVSGSERAKVFANRAFAYQKAGAANQADARAAPLSSRLCAANVPYVLLNGVYGACRRLSASMQRRSDGRDNRPVNYKRQARRLCWLLMDLEAELLMFCWPTCSCVASPLKAWSSTVSWSVCRPEHPAVTEDAAASPLLLCHSTVQLNGSTGLLKHSAARFQCAAGLHNNEAVCS